MRPSSKDQVQRDSAGIAWRKMLMLALAIIVSVGVWGVVIVVVVGVIFA